MNTNTKHTILLGGIAVLTLGNIAVGVSNHIQLNKRAEAPKAQVVQVSSPTPIATASATASPSASPRKLVK